jgi:hemoglobin-like flavoprotein
MTPEQKMRVRTSFATLSSKKDIFAARFYSRLFELDPSLRPLFQGDLQEQGRKFVEMLETILHSMDLETILHSMDRLDRVVPSVWQVGRRHGRYGVRPEHYATVGTALFETLHQCLGSDFTEEVRTAWQEAYDLIALTMQQAAEA